MSLIAKCILSDPSPEDGLRISIMSRHTYDDGITLRLDLDKMCDKHYPRLGPSPKLIGRWIRKEISWSYYVIEYENEMRSIEPMKLIEDIIRRARKRNITVMCIEESSKRCHRRLFLKICKEISPSLVIVDK